MRMGKLNATSNMGITLTETGKNIQLGHMQIYSRAMIRIIGSADCLGKSLPFFFVASSSIAMNE